MRIEQLTFPRFVLAIVVVIYHYGANAFPFNLPVIDVLISKGGVRTSFFFILSGFMMVIVYGKNLNAKLNVWRYYLNRIARIFPLYLAALLFILLKAALLDVISWPEALIHTLAVQAWLPGEALQLNFPGWTISVEIFFYMLFPLCYRYYQRASLRRLAFLIISVWIASQILSNYLHFSTYFTNRSVAKEFLLFFPLFHLNEFLAGNVAGLIYLQVKDKKQANYDFLIFLITGLTMLAIYFNDLFLVHNGLLAILFAPLIIIISLNTGNLTKLFSLKPLGSLGEISYGIFILQLPVYMGVSKILQVSTITDPTLSFYLYLSMLILVSALAYRFFELPARNRIRNLTLASMKAWTGSPSRMGTGPSTRIGPR